MKPGAPGTTRTCGTRFRKPDYHCSATHRNHSAFSDSRSGSLSTLFYSLCLDTTRFETTMERTESLEVRVFDGSELAAVIREHSGSSWASAPKPRAKRARNGCPTAANDNQMRAFRRFA